MGRRTWHISADGDDHGGPILDSENGPQRASHGERGGPVHHMMVGPRHETQGAIREKLPAQLRTWVVAVLVGTLMRTKKMEHGGMDSDPFLFRILSPSIRFLHHIYSFPHLQAEGVIDTSVKEMKGQAENVQRGCLAEVARLGRPLASLRLRRQSIYL